MFVRLKLGKDNRAVTKTHGHVISRLFFFFWLTLTLIIYLISINRNTQYQHLQTDIILKHEALVDFVSMFVISINYNGFYKTIKKT